MADWTQGEGGGGGGQIVKSYQSGYWSGDIYSGFWASGNKTINLGTKVNPANSIVLYKYGRRGRVEKDLSFPDYFPTLNCRITQTIATNGASVTFALSGGGLVDAPIRNLSFVVIEFADPEIIQTIGVAKTPIVAPDYPASISNVPIQPVPAERTLFFQCEESMIISGIYWRDDIVPPWDNVGVSFNFITPIAYNGKVTQVRIMTSQENNYVYAKGYIVTLKG